VCAVLLSFAHARADETRTLPIIEVGAHFFAGTAEESLTGSRAYPIVFRSEAQRGQLRLSIATEFLFSSGSTSVTSTSTTYTLYGASFNPSYNYFVFREGYFQPFVGVGGIVGWNYFKMTTPPTGVDAYTQGYAYGYELSAGVDIRFSNADSSALRLRAALVSLSSQIAELSPFALGGFRFLVGYVY